MKGRELPSNNKWELLAGHFHYDMPKILGVHNPIRVTQLRHPVDRYVSNFYDWKRVSDLPHFDTKTRQEFFRLDLDEFLGNNDLRETFANVPVRLFGSKISRQTFDEILDPFARGPSLSYSVDRAVKRIADFAVVGLQEDFPGTLDLLSYHLRRRPMQVPPRLNVDPKRPARPSLSPSARQEIIELNEDDFLLYEAGSRRFKALSDGFAEAMGSPSGSARTTPILERRYRKTLLSATRVPIPRLVRVDAAEFQGRGWWAPEYPPYRVFRWTSGNGVSDLDFVVPATDLVVRFLIENSITPFALSGVTGFANERNCDVDIVSRPDGKHEIRMRVPRRLITREKGFLRCGIKPGETASPNEMDPTNSDVRRLGLAVGAVRLESFVAG